MTAAPLARANRQYLLMAVAPVLFLAVFFLWPLGEILRLSVTDPQPGLGNYARLVTSSSLQRVVWTTAWVSVVTTAVTLVLSYVVAYALAGLAGLRFEVMLALLLLPLWSSVVVQAFGWLLILRSDGLVNSLLLDLGVISSPLTLVRNELGTLIGMVAFMLPVGATVLLPNLRGIDPQLTLAAKSLGATPWQAFRDVFLPESIPGIVGAGAVLFILAAGFFGIPAILGGGKVMMIAEYVSVQVLQMARWGSAAMLTTILVATFLLILVSLSRVIDLRRVLVGA